MPHIHEKIDFCVEVFVVYGDKVLLRRHDKYKYWLSVGGHIELDEGPVQAVLREVREEVGLDVEIVPTQETLSMEKERYDHIVAPAYMNKHMITDEHSHVTFVYFAKSDSNRVVEGVEREKSESCSWFTSEEVDAIESDISETVRYYAKKAIEVVNNNQ